MEGGGFSALGRGCFNPRENIRYKCARGWVLYLNYKVSYVYQKHSLLSFGAESVVFQVAIQKLKDQDI